MSRPLRWLAGVLAGLGALLALLLWLQLRDEAPSNGQNGSPTPGPIAAMPASTAEQLARGAYLARAGNCAACHTARGGAPYAGGRAIDTPFGAVFAGNLTPDAATGLGAWNADDFWRALHHGRSRDGRLLTPAFPYPNFTLVTRDDADALWAWLRTLPPVAQPNRPHALRWPFNTQMAQALWRTLYFRPGSFEPDPALSATVNRGAYLVNGLGHCGACHASRNPLGGSGALDDAGGSALPNQPWIAPSLTDAAAGGVPGRSADELVRLLKTGVSARATVMGPMAEVVAGSTQHLSEPDLHAMVAYLLQLPHAPAPTPPARTQRPPEAMARGEQLYADHCADCHGAQGQGAPGIYPPLAGNPTVTMADARNLVRAITRGGFPPATAGNPRPYGMPGFDLPHADLAALATWLRAAWGHDATPVMPVDVLLVR